MMVGLSGSGKLLVWWILLKVLENVEGVEGVVYVVDFKVIFKEVLYGILDFNIREWIDGLFIYILRK